MTDPLAQVISRLRPNAAQISWKLRNVSSLAAAIIC